ncbi:MAG: hypothetical protein QM817_30135 [Archangium sp.]
MAPLLVLLVGELTSPLKPHVEAALPAAFVAPLPEVSTGSDAPPGRNVVWVTMTSPDEVVLTLHTARIPGDLRRELRFNKSDSPAARGKTIAFALSVLAKEREADLAALPPEPGPPPPVAPAPPAEKVWEIEARGVGTLSVGEGALGGGGQVLAHRLLPFGLSTGLGVELNASGAKETQLTQGGAWAEVNLRFVGPIIVPRLSLGVGAMVNVLVGKQNVMSTVWLPLFRIAVDATWRFFEGHGITLGLASHLTTAGLPVGTTNGTGMGMGMGNTKNMGTLGPLWMRVELGYSLAL